MKKLDYDYCRAAPVLEWISISDMGDMRKCSLP